MFLSKFDNISEDTEAKLNNITDVKILDKLLLKAASAESMGQFEVELKKAMEE